MKKYFQHLLVATALACFWGCASNRQSPATAATRVAEKELRVGMTKDEVTAALGNPSGVRVTDQGVQTWIYDELPDTTVPRSMAAYAESGGKVRRVTIHFDESGRVRNWSSGNEPYR